MITSSPDDRPTNERLHGSDGPLQTVLKKARWGSSSRQMRGGGNRGCYPVDVKEGRPIVSYERRKDSFQFQNFARQTKARQFTKETKHVFVIHVKSSLAIYQDDAGLTAVHTAVKACCFTKCIKQLFVLL